MSLAPNSLEAGTGFVASREPDLVLVTGVAGFIGSHLANLLIRCGFRVRGVDDFSTGSRLNLDLMALGWSGEERARFEFRVGSLADARVAREAVSGVQLVSHQAAVGSVPRSVADPARAFRANTEAFFNLLEASRHAGVRRFVYASSSSVYGDSPVLPRVEALVGNPLSPYAATKRANEVFAESYARIYGMRCIGLRYFNVYGPRQNPAGDYAAVIPRWVNTLLAGGRPQLNGDGATSRDFTYVADVTEANRLALTCEMPESAHWLLNIACGRRTTLRELFERIRVQVAAVEPAAAAIEPAHASERAGDVRHSNASIERARELLGYEPRFDLPEGLALTIRAAVAGRRRTPSDTPA